MKKHAFLLSSFISLTIPLSSSPTIMSYCNKEKTVYLIEIKYI